MKSFLSWFVIIAAFAVLVSSCAKSDDSTTASTDNATSSSSDTTAPTVSSVSTTADNQSSVSITDNITVTFSEAMDTTYVTTSTSDTNCAGTIRVSSDNFSTCVKMSSEPVSSNSNKTFTLDPYDNLTVGTTYKTRVTTGVKDTAGNALSSQYDDSTGFAPVDLTAPTVTSVSTTADNQSAVSITDNITVTFSEAMDNTTVTTNTDNTSCYGTLGVSSDNFSSCVQMSSSSPTSSNDNQTFTLDPSDNLTGGTTYLTRVTTGVKDTAGNALSSQYDNSTGFTTASSSSISGLFVAVGVSGDIVRSTDNGSTWDNATSPTANFIAGVEFGNNTFVGVGDNGNIVRSTDNGSSFDNTSSPTATHLTGVTFGNNTFVGVGDNGNIVRSTDNGSSFDNASSPTSNNINVVTFGNNTFVGVGVSGNIVRSTDNGSSFDNVTSPTANDIYGVTFGNNTFVGVGLYGNIVRSTDNGSSFDNVTSSTTNHLAGVTWAE